MTSSYIRDKNNKLKIMLVDDSVVIRGFIARIIEANEDMEIVGSVQNGQMAINALKNNNPDIIILDIEMPVMDGITALPKLLEARPDTKIIMCSTLTKRNADITLKAMSLGAVDCIAKPTSSVEIRSRQDFGDGLIRMIRQIGATTKTRANKNDKKEYVKPKIYGEKKHELNKNTLPLPKPKIVAIGSSTGGPQALFALIKNFKNLKVPIIVTQHMPATFTKILAQHIEQQTGVVAIEGDDGMELENGKVYVAPGGFHMTFENKNGKTTIVKNNGNPENFCKPSVDPMIRSAMSIYGRNILAVMLTGMGNDGLISYQELVKEGGFCVAQDEDSSVVWGMPGAVAMAGICTEVLPLDKLGPWVVSKI